MHGDLNFIKSELEKINGDLKGLELKLENDYIEEDDDKLSIKMTTKGTTSFIPGRYLGKIEITRSNIEFEIFSGGGPMNVSIITNNDANELRKLADAIKVIADDRETLESYRNAISKFVTFE